jgi:hypothetical protein
LSVVTLHVWRYLESRTLQRVAFWTVWGNHNPNMVKLDSGLGRRWHCGGREQNQSNGSQVVLCS